MKTTKTMPAWAIELTAQVCKDYNRKLPTTINWRQRRDTWHEAPEHSSGHMRRVYNWRTKKYSGVMAVTAGTSVTDQRLVLLHELAHHIVSKSKRQGHSIRFWRLAFELYERYGVDLDYANEREKDYKVKANQAYAEVLAKK